MNDQRAEAGRDKLLDERMRRSVRLSLRDRVGNGFLFREFESGSLRQAEYSPWSYSARGREGYADVPMEADGFVTDIHVGELSRLVDYLDYAARQRGIGPAGDLELHIGSGNVAMQRYRHLLPRAEAKPPRVLKLLGQHFAGERSGDAVLALPSALLDDESVSLWVRHALPRVFQVSSGRRPADQLHRHMVGTRDRLIKACRDEAVDEVDRLTGIYVRVADRFMTELSRVGATYPAEAAEKERSSVFDQWSELAWLSRHLRQILDVGIRSQNSDIVLTVAYVPFRIVTSALLIGDHLLFQEFTEFAAVVDHRCGAGRASATTAQMLTDGLRMWIRDLVDLRIMPGLGGESHGGEPDPLTYVGFAHQVLRVYQELIKSAYDRRDLEVFTGYVEGLSRLFNRLTRARGHAMEQPETLDAARAILHGHREVFFGLCAWVFDQRLEDAAVEEYHAVLRAHLPAGLRCLTALWLSAEEDRSWHWDRWEMTDSEEVQVLDFGRKLRQVYVAQALRILAGMPDTERAAVTVESSRELAVTARDDGPLTRLLDQVESAPDDWSNLLTTAEASSVDALRRILLHARSAHEETERVSLRAASIDPGKVGGFIARFLEEVNDSASVRQLLRIHDATQDTSSAPLAEGAGKGWRTASLTPKHAFVDMEGMVFGSLGGQVGHDLAVRENATLLTEMVTGLRPHEVDSETQIPGEVADLIGDSDWQNPVLIMTFDPDNHGHAFWDSDVAVRRWKEPTEHSKHADLDSYEGFVQCGDVRVPVFQVFVPDWSDAQGTFLLVSLSSLGVLTQHMPLEREEDDEYVHDRFCIRVQDLNADDEERARMLADQSPRPDNGSDADREDRLREQVLVTIRQKFAFVTRDASAGVRLVVAGQGQSDGEAPA